MIQTVLELDLADYANDYPRSFDAYEFERRQREQLRDLPPGSCVRLRVGECRPLLDGNFFRRDLIWQIVGNDTRTLDAWHELMEGAPVADY
ncbi:hypothetical protein AB4Y86_14725 [Arthrobacter sp. 2YAF22_2]|uniref:hypothetical protein n=1 Tax=Arthrobacter sp. 2YAF22_2 TaxID=3233029 RepID=UPI003F8E0F91